MCVNTKYIWNKYIRRRVLVNCGKCPSCMQMKASGRASRIRSNIKEGEICLFVTLTYKNEFVPYIDVDDLKYGANFDVPVRRHCHGRFVRCGSGYDTEFQYPEFCLSGSIVDYIPLCYCDAWDFSKKNEYGLRHLVGRPQNEIGVCYYPDVQDFFKRLRQILIRNFNFHEKFTYFSCSEYGSETQRPHFHLLLFIPSVAEQVFRDAIIKAWPYADCDRTRKFTEVARDCASYVASYVNGNAVFSEVLQASFTRQKHSYSKGFGVGLSSLSALSILQKIDERNLTYCREVKINGVRTYVTLPVPQYALYRLFPKFKGFSRLSSDSLYQLLRCFTDPGTNIPLEWLWNSFPESHEICFTFDEFRAVSVRLRNCYLRFKAITGKSTFDYIDYYIRCWNLYASQSIILSHAGKHDKDYLQFYDNIPIEISGGYFPLSLYYLCQDFGFSLSDFPKNQNVYNERIGLTNQYEQVYYFRTKQKKFTNSLMSYMGLDV